MKAVGWMIFACSWEPASRGPMHSRTPVMRIRGHDPQTELDLGRWGPKLLTTRVERRVGSAMVNLVIQANRWPFGPGPAGSAIRQTASVHSRKGLN